jgi:EAL domain-containing protein (putative c-di-GMP-specific phosphodiesterase class I)/ActR/RegA family two-component response regulator
MKSNGARLLVVDDDEQLLRAHRRLLVHHGYDVTTAVDGSAAMLALEQATFDVIVSDIDMPEMDGIRLLERVRARDLDVPVVLVTGAPSVDTAIQATAQGALRYLVKPVEPQALLDVVAGAVRLHGIAKAKRQALELAGGFDRFVGDRAGLVASYGRALESLRLAYQPIVSWSSQSVFAYEALLRSREPTLPHPGAVLDAAERLDRVHELGRRIRALAAQDIDRLPKQVALFVNLHPTDLLDDELFAPNGSLASASERVVLEITERAALDKLPDVRSRIARLRSLGFRIALDDLGAGHAGLASFTLLEPDIVKLDMALVRDIHRQPTKQTVVRTMTTMCKELGIVVTAEGVETPEERDQLVNAGTDLLQGYLFAKPGDPFPEPRF